MEKYTEIIYGKVPSKSNSYKIVTIGGHASLCKTKQLVEYERNFYLQCKSRDVNLNKPFKLSVDVYYNSNRPDLDNALKVILDCLQSCKTITNDRNCVNISARKFLDKNNPRIELLIEEIL